MNSKYDSHCTKPGCICDHSVSCHRGWRDTDNGQTRPCQTCRVDTHARWVRTLDARIAGLPAQAIARIWTTNAS